VPSSCHRGQPAAVLPKALVHRVSQAPIHVSGTDLQLGAPIKEHHIVEGAKLVEGSGGQDHFDEYFRFAHREVELDEPIRSQRHDSYKLFARIECHDTSLADKLT